MKVRVLSDLHLEFAPLALPRVEADVIALAGDIHIGCAGIRWARKAFPGKPILYVPGNHEFYGRERLEALDRMRKAAEEVDVRLLDEEIFEWAAGRNDRVRFLGCTLWTDFCLFGHEQRGTAVWAAEHGLNDFHLISEQGIPFRAEQSAVLHARAVRWLEGMLATPFDGTTVVMTHHAPSRYSIEPRYRNDVLSACFASSLDAMFGSMAVWIHGHTHAVADYESQGTRVICNPRGYQFADGRKEETGFREDLVVEVVGEVDKAMVENR